MSGGVDSSVAAALLKQQGYSLLGVFMHFWSEPDVNPLAATSRFAKAPSSPGHKTRAAQCTRKGQLRSQDLISKSNKCCSIEAQEQARRVAQKIGIPLYTVNYKKPFRDIIVDNYISEYRAGRTPNPCVLCNQFIKFDLLLREAKKQGCDFLATGHYARIKNGKLYKSVDDDKDQTYFLYRLDKDKLKKILFPVGKYKKLKVRKIAAKMELPTATRKDSRGICFVSTTNEKFLKKYLKVKPGSIIDINGVEIGKHQGLLYYTVGQRHIGKSNIKYQKSKILGKDKSLVPPLYVVSVDVKNNALVIGREEDLYKKELIAEGASWIAGKAPSSKNISARIRYRHPINKVRIEKISSNKYKVIFNKTQRAITPGQSIVFYQGDQVSGGGIIAK